LATVYFLQSEKYNWHFGFAKKYLLTRVEAAHPYAHHRFNKKQYLEDDRDYVLGSLVKYNDQERICFELWAGDTIDAARFVDVFRHVSSLIELSGQTVSYRPMSEDQETRIAPQIRNAGFPVLTAKDLFGNSKLFF
jgi:hypothetical protein